MDDPARDHDLIRTQAEQQTLRAAAIAAFAPVAAGDADAALLARLRGDEAAALGKWSRGRRGSTRVAEARAGRRRDARRPSLRGLASRRRRARGRSIDARSRELAPSYSAYVSLGRAQAKLGTSPRRSRRSPRPRRSAKTPAQLAWTNLYYGRRERPRGNRAEARAALRPRRRGRSADPRGEPAPRVVLERAQEGTVALAVAPGSRPALSLAPWTGPDLPGSIASTYKYRLIVTGAPGTRIGLAAGGLPPRWIGSFCTDRVCAPFRTAVVLPAEGVKVVEFQIVPRRPPASARSSVSHRCDRERRARGRNVRTLVHV